MVNKAINGNGWMKWGTILSVIVVLIGVAGCAWRVAESARADTNTLKIDFREHRAAQEQRDIRMEENMTEIRTHLEKIETKLEK